MTEPKMIFELASTIMSESNEVTTNSLFVTSPETNFYGGPLVPHDY